MERTYVIERFVRDGFGGWDLVSGSAKSVGSDEKQAREILEDDRATGHEYRMRVVYA